MNKDLNNVSMVANTAGDLIAQGQAIQAIQTSYATAVAVQKPRVLVEVERRCVQEAELEGESCFFGWGSGKDRVEGPSIKCAMIAVRNWGNAVIEMKALNETDTAYIMEAAFVDLETGFTYSRQFRQSKRSIVYGKMDEVRKDDIRFQIGQSKTQRNVILNGLPGWLINKMIDAAKQGVRTKLEDYIKAKSIESARNLTLKALNKHGVKLERIEEKYGKKYGGWDIELLIVLKGDIRALADGAESADALFPEAPEEEKPSGGKTKSQKMADNLKKKDDKKKPEPKEDDDLKQRRTEVRNNLVRCVGKELCKETDYLPAIGQADLAQLAEINIDLNKMLKQNEGTKK